MLDQALASFGSLHPGDAQGLAVEGRGPQVGDLLDLLQLFIGDGLIGECAHSARFAKESGDLVFGQAGHTYVLSVK